MVFLYKIITLIQATSSHATVMPTAPELMSCMQVVPPGDEYKNQTARIPLLEQAGQSEDSVVCQEVGAGRVVYLATSDHSVLNRYVFIHVCGI